MWRGISLLSRTVGFNELVIGGVCTYIGAVGYQHAAENSCSVREAFFGGLAILGAIVVYDGYSLLKRRYGPERAGVEQLIRPAEDWEGLNFSLI